MASVRGHLLICSLSLPLESIRAASAEMLEKVDLCESSLPRPLQHTSANIAQIILHVQATWVSCRSKGSGPRGMLANDSSKRLVIRGADLLFESEEIRFMSRVVRASACKRTT